MVTRRKNTAAALERTGARTPMAVRAGAAAAGVQLQWQKTVADVIRLLAAVVARLRLPLLVVALAPVPPGLVLVVASAVQGGSDLALAGGLVVVGLVPSGWLALRRAQLLAALQPPTEAAAEICRVLSPTGLWSQLKANLGRITEGGGPLRLRSLGRRIWQGVRLTADVRGLLGDQPRLAPFLPARLRGLAVLAACCLVSSVALTALAVVKVLATAVGLG